LVALSALSSVVLMMASLNATRDPVLSFNLAADTAACVFSCAPSDNSHRHCCMRAYPATTLTGTAACVRTQRQLSQALLHACAPSDNSHRHCCMRAHPATTQTLTRMNNSESFIGYAAFRSLLRSPPTLTQTRTAMSHAFVAHTHFRRCSMTVAHAATWIFIGGGCLACVHTRSITGCAPV
jgi:hypothetical protein